MRYFYALPFVGELDMLRCQLLTHGDKVHKFIVMEANVDHAGQRKPFVLEANWDSFEQWHHQIEYIKADWLPGFEAQPDFWYREQNQRDTGMPYLMRYAEDNDIIIVSDMDEFIPDSAFELSPSPFIGLVQKLRFAAVDWGGSPGVTAVMARCSVLRSGRYTCDTLRQHRESFPPVEPGGYHFSWFGGPESFRRKAIRSPHQESLVTNVRLAQEGFAWQRGLGGIPDNDIVTGSTAEVTDDYPQHVRDRDCPWYWWRPAADMLPVDGLAREREIRRREISPFVTGTCQDGREVRVLEPGSYHTDDLTPCPTAEAKNWQV